MVLSGLLGLYMSNSNGNSTFFTEGINGSKILPSADPTPNMKSLLSEEIENNFGSPISIVKTTTKFIRILIVPAILYGLIRCFCGSGVGRAWLMTYSHFIVASLPVYIIAHDWGRFAGYSFWMAVACSTIPNIRLGNQVSGFVPHQREDEEPTFVRAIRMGGLPSLMFISSIVVLAILWSDYRISGVKLPALLALALLSAIYVSYRLTARFKRTWSG
jgi:hypothetical protein